MEREITEEYIEELRILCSKEPKKVEKELIIVIEIIKDHRLLCLAFRVLSLVYYYLKENEKEIANINNSIEYAIDIESRIFGFIRRGAYYFNNGNFLNAYLDYSKSLDLFSTNQLSSPNILILIKMNLLILYRGMNTDLISESIFEEIEDLIPKVDQPTMIANFYWIKGVWSFDNKSYKNAIEHFEIAIKKFKILRLEYEEKQVYPKIAISMYVLGIDDYNQYLTEYLDYLKDKSIGLFGRFVIGICMVGYNPLLFIKISVPKFLRIISFYKRIKNYKSLSFLFQYLGEYYSIRHNDKEALIAFQNYFKYKKLNDQESEEKLQIENAIKSETAKILSRKSNQTTYSYPAQPNVIQEYVHSELNSKVVDQLTISNESVITQLLVKEFLQKIPINTSDGTIFLEVSQVAMLKAEGSYVIFFDKDKKRYTTSRNLAHYQRILDPKIFLRIHHSYIINRNYLQKLYHGKAGKIVLTNGLEAEVSVRKSSSIKKILLDQN